jgi:hypothetical protein
MNASIESTSRGPTDCFHFAITCLGAIIGIAGVITTTMATSICGLVLIAFGLAYFLMQSCLED